MTTPHDAEEAMRPYLGKLYDATDACVHDMVNRDARNPTAYLTRLELKATAAALEKALELLGVHDA